MNIPLYNSDLWATGTGTSHLRTIRLQVPLSIFIYFIYFNHIAAKRAQINNSMNSFIVRTSECSMSSDHTTVCASEARCLPAQSHLNTYHMMTWKWPQFFYHLRRLCHTHCLVQCTILNLNLNLTHTSALASKKKPHTLTNAYS